MTEQRQSQAEELSTGERMATYLGAAADGVAHEAKGETETSHGTQQRVALSDAERIIEAWPQPNQRVARQLLDKYGPPNEATPTKLFWYHNGPWKETKITSDVVTHNFPAPHTDFLTQVVNYRVPPDMIGAIAEWDGSVIVDRTKGEVAARCDAEAANILAMNLVHEIVTGKRTVEEAREATAENTVAYSMGRNAPYAERLLFEAPTDGTEDLDSSMISGAVAHQAAGKVKDAFGGGDQGATDRRTGADTQPRT
ncbi:MAG TPA: hypothetical protein VM324_12385 [Egibacteraceae bacterium]|nr:hypothetical protein [Egibacteraceae bacterium]